MPTKEVLEAAARRRLLGKENPYFVYAPEKFDGPWTEDDEREFSTAVRADADILADYALTLLPVDGEAVTKRSQVQSCGGPAPLTWGDYEAGCLNTFGGGYQKEHEREIFRHGMSTVFNLLRREFPPAEKCQALGVTLNEPTH